MEEVSELLKLPKSECPDIWTCPPRHKWQKSWSNIEAAVVPLKRNLHGHPHADVLWERQVEKVLFGLGWEKVPNCECPFVQREQCLFLSVYVDDMNLGGRKQNLNTMWEKLMKLVDLGEPPSYLDHVYLGCTQRDCKSNESIMDEYRKMFESRISPGATEKLPGWGTRSLGLLTWKGMRKMRETIDIASQQINQSSNCIRYLHHVLTTINSKKKNWKRWENCKKSALKLS